MQQSPVLLLLGFGYVAAHLARGVLKLSGWRVLGTYRSEDGRKRCLEAGVEPVAYHELEHDGWWQGGGAQASHVLSSIPPTESGDPAIQQLGRHLVALAGRAFWLGYLSTTGVYGDYGGAWVSETDALKGRTPRLMRRIAAEQAWLSLWEAYHLPVHVFRLSGIYGPRRNVLEDLRHGQARCVVKEGHVFSRIHVDDIVQALELSMHKPLPGEIFNLADDMPAASQDVVSSAAELLGMAPPPPLSYQQLPDGSMLREFFSASRRVANLKAKKLLGWEPRFPTYHHGLQHEMEALQPIQIRREAG